jgi:hypothetical protein
MIVRISKAVVNELHARVCDALATANMLRDAQANYPAICPPPCSFLDYANKYYGRRASPSSSLGPKFQDSLLKLILASILGKLNSDQLLTISW